MHYSRLEKVQLILNIVLFIHEAIQEKMENNKEYIYHVQIYLKQKTLIIVWKIKSSI